MDFVKTILSSNAEKCVNARTVPWEKGHVVGPSFRLLFVKQYTGWHDELDLLIVKDIMMLNN